MDDAGMSPRKQMASDGGPSFGVGKINTGTRSMNQDMDTGRTLRDSERGAGPNMSRGGGMMRAERNSDHGPHGMGKRA